VYLIARLKSFACFAVLEIRPILMSLSVLILCASLIVLPYVVLADPRGMRMTMFSRFSIVWSIALTMTWWCGSAS